MTQLALLAEAPAPSPAIVTSNTRALRPYQTAAVEAIFGEWEELRSTLLVLPTGCHRAGQLVMMFDGSLRRVEDVLPGELLMGPDSTPRRVLELAGGAGPMVEIRPTKGQPWTVNLDHVLTLVRTPTHPRRPYPSGQGGALVDVTVREWLRWSAHRKHTHKLLRVAVDFPPSAPVPVSPWVIGLMLGDGSLSRRNAAEFTNVDAEVIEEARREAAVMGLRLTSYKPKNRASCHRFSGAIGRSENYLTARLRGLGLLGISCENRFIPHEYKTASRADRLRLLAGLMDSDGHGVRGGYDYTSKSRYLADDVAFVARSLGLAAYVKQCRKGCQAGAVGTYYRVSISGDCAAVPCVMAKKRHGVRRQKKERAPSRLCRATTRRARAFLWVLSRQGQALSP